MAPESAISVDDFLDVVESREGVRQRFFPGVTQRELGSVRGLLADVSARTEFWCRTWSIFNLATIVPVSLVNIAQLYPLGSDAILTRIKHSLWIYALDDMFDDDGLAEAEVVSIIRDCELSACRPSIQPSGGELARSLRGIQLELAQYPMYEELYPIWISTLITSFNGMMYERWLHRRLQVSGDDAALPSYEEYMHYGRDSSSVTHLWITGLMLERDPSIKTVLPELYALSEQCAVVVRLANDRATYSRERGERVVNAVALALNAIARENGAATPNDLPEAVSRVEARLQMERQRLDEMASRTLTETGIAQRYARATQLTADIYALGDFRSWKARVEAEVGGRLSLETLGDA